MYKLTNFDLLFFADVQSIVHLWISFYYFSSQKQLAWNDEQVSYIIFRWRWEILCVLSHTHAALMHTPIWECIFLINVCSNYIFFLLKSLFLALTFKKFLGGNLALTFKILGRWVGGGEKERIRTSTLCAKFCKVATCCVLNQDTVTLVILIDPFVTRPSTWIYN